MIMKIATYVLAALLVLTLGAGAFFFLQVHQPMAEDLAQIKAGLPAFEKAKADQKKLKELEARESREAAWLAPASEAATAALGNEIKAGLAEVFVAGNKVVVNISEQALFLRNAYTFAKESPPLRATIADLLKNEKLKGKNITIGNTTQAVPAQGKGRKKIPAKEARVLANERSAVLVKDFEKNGVNQDTLISAAYSSAQPELGFKIKDRKTVIIIENPLALPQAAPKQEAAPDQVKPAAAAPEPPAAAQAQQKSIPIQVQPKAQ